MIGGIAAFTIPSSENLTSERGEAAQASAMPCLRFFLTLAARPFVAGELSDIRFKSTRHAAVPTSHEWAAARAIMPP